MDYKDKLKLAKEALDSGSYDKETIEYIFPELAESEDEKIRKELIEFVKSRGGFKQEYIAWLEKQGEQKPTDKIEPKFKVGDWIVNKLGNIWHIDSFDAKNYQVTTNKGEHNYFPINIQDRMHIWTIQDAKPGDVLYHKAENGIEYIVMNKSLNEFNNIDSYFRYHSIDGFNTDIPSVLSAKCDSITPATKEQRDFLFQKMKEDGYEWDAEKKKLLSKPIKYNSNPPSIDKKSDWSEEDDWIKTKIIKVLLGCETFLTSEETNECIDWIKSIKQRLKGKS